MKYLVFLALVLAVIYTQQGITPIQNVPIQKNFDSRTMGNTANPFKIEVFYDLQCPDCKAHNEIFQKIFKQIDIFNQDQLQFVINYFPLPYHYSSYYIGIGYSYVASNFSSQQVNEYVNAAFELQDQFANSQIKSSEKSEIFEELAKAITKKCSFLDYGKFLTALSDSEYQTQTTYASKYGLGRQVSGTPFIFAQGILVDGSEEWTYDQWVEFLKKYTDLKF